MLSRNEIRSAAVAEFEKALAANPALLDTDTKRTVSIRLSVHPREEGVLVSGAATINGNKHMSFGTLVCEGVPE